MRPDAQAVFGDNFKNENNPNNQGCSKAGARRRLRRRSWLNKPAGAEAGGPLPLVFGEASRRRAAGPVFEAIRPKKVRSRNQRIHRLASGLSALRFAARSGNRPHPHKKQLSTGRQTLATAHRSVTRCAIPTDLQHERLAGNNTFPDRRPPRRPWRLSPTGEYPPRRRNNPAPPNDASSPPPRRIHSSTLAIKD
jgi:hypothetical protein